jgi:hypothetical protein
MPAPLIETDDIEVLRTQFAAWMEGVESRFLGLSVPDCPHEPRTAAGDAWENGWGVCDQRLKYLDRDIEHLRTHVSKLMERLPMPKQHARLAANLDRLQNAIATAVKELTSITRGYCPEVGQMYYYKTDVDRIFLELESHTAEPSTIS